VQRHILKIYSFCYHVPTVVIVILIQLLFGPTPWGRPPVTRLGDSWTYAFILTPRTTLLLTVIIKKEEKLDYLEIYLSSN